MHLLPNSHVRNARGSRATISMSLWCRVAICSEIGGKISFVMYCKVSNDPESKPIPLQSRDYTALAGRDNVCTNLGKPYPCPAKDLDYPKKRDTWLDKNEKEMIRQRGLVSSTFR